MVYTDKPLWTKIGKSIAYFGIFIFVYVSLGLIITKNETSTFKFYDSKKNIVATSTTRFFGVVSSHELLKEYNYEQLTITTHQSYFGNFSRNAQINPINLKVITIGIYALIFSLCVLILSISALYVLKKMYYIFLTISFFNVIFIAFVLLMII